MSVDWIKMEMEMAENSALVLLDATSAIQQARQLNDLIVAMRKDILHSGIDYGVIPGTSKPTLYKPGAEKLCRALGLSPDFDALTCIERFEDENPLFYYRYRCNLIHIETGKIVGSGIGSCNSMEDKYRWRWVWANQVPSDVDKATLVTKTTRNGSLQYRLPNDNMFSIVNTIDKMAQKRALIAAVLIAANASEFFTQDLEDMPDFGSVGDSNIIEADFTEVPPTTKPAKATEPTKPTIEWPSEAAIEYILNMAKGKGWGDTEADLLEMLDGKTWSDFETGKDAVAAIETNYSAAFDGMGGDKPLTSMGGNVTKALYWGKYIEFKLQGKSLRWYKGRTELAAAVGEPYATQWDITNWKESGSPLVPAEYGVDLLVEAVEQETKPDANGKTTKYWNVVNVIVNDDLADLPGPSTHGKDGKEKDIA